MSFVQLISISPVVIIYIVLYRWDDHGEIGFSSECVEILFYAIYNTSKQIAEKAVPLQKRNVVDHIAESVNLSLHVCEFPLLRLLGFTFPRYNI